MKPLTKNQLVERLLAIPHGQIFLWNLLDGHAEKLFDPDDLRTFFWWWRKAFSAVDTEAPLPDGSDPLFVTLDLLRLAPHQWSSLDAAMRPIRGWRLWDQNRNFASFAAGSPVGEYTREYSLLRLTPRAFLLTLGRK